MKCDKCKDTGRVKTGAGPYALYLLCGCGQAPKEPRRDSRPYGGDIYAMLRAQGKIHPEALQ